MEETTETALGSVTREIEGSIGIEAGLKTAASDSTLAAIARATKPVSVVKTGTRPLASLLVRTRSPTVKSK